MENVNLEHTGRVIKAARKFMKLRQIEFADKYKMSQSLLSKIEKGMMSPSIDTWLRVCKDIKAEPIETYETGFIQVSVRKTASFFDSKHGFRWKNKKYKTVYNYKSIDLVPIYNLLGDDLWKSFCEKKIDPNIIFLVHAPLSAEFVNDLYFWLQLGKVRGKAKKALSLIEKLLDSRNDFFSKAG